MGFEEEGQTLRPTRSHGFANKSISGQGPVHGLEHSRINVYRDEGPGRAEGGTRSARTTAGHDAEGTTVAAGFGQRHYFLDPPRPALGRLSSNVPLPGYSDKPAERPKHSSRHTGYSSLGPLAEPVYPDWDAITGRYRSGRSSMEIGVDFPPVHGHHSRLPTAASSVTQAAYRYRQDRRFTAPPTASEPATNETTSPETGKSRRTSGDSWITCISSDSSATTNHPSWTSTAAKPVSFQGVLSGSGFPRHSSSQVSPRHSAPSGHGSAESPNRVQGFKRDGFQAPEAVTTPSPRPHKFHPMAAIYTPPSSLFERLHLSSPDTAGGGDLGFSPAYVGARNESNASADIPDDQNCSLWLTKLPADVSYAELLDLITLAGPFGRVHCTFINYPDGDKHQLAAAKVVFFRAESAQRMLTRSWTSGLDVRGHRLAVTHNRIRTREVPPGPARASRVLLVTGRTGFASVEALARYFESKFVFQADSAKELLRAGGRAVVEFRFGSYRCQAQMGKMALERERPEGFEKVEFGEDPCEVGETYSSYGVAAERIQGKGI